MECVSPLFDPKDGQYIYKEQSHTMVNIVRLSVGYPKATINSKTRNSELEIGPEGSSQTWPNPRVNRYLSGFGLQ